jgi:nucleoid DNA-binding protein
MTKKPPMGESDYGKEYLIEEIAKRAKFTKGDIRIVMKAFEEVILDIIKEQKSITVTHLFRIQISKVKAFRAWDARLKEYWDRPETWKVRMYPSHYIQKILNKVIGQPECIHDMVEKEFEEEE